MTPKEPNAKTSSHAIASCLPRTAIVKVRKQSILFGYFHYAYEMQYGMIRGSMILDECRTAGRVIFVYPYRLE
jgi:hypothetical protein